MRKEKGFTEYKPIFSDGRLPNDEVKGIFQYKRFIHWNTFELYAQGLGRLGQGHWEMQILAPDGQTVLFEQTVTIAITVVFTGFSLIWYQHETGEKIETTIVAGNETTPESPSWEHTIGGTHFSEQGIMIPGGGVVPGSQGTGYTVEADWQSPAYKMRLPAGSRLKIVTDHWGLGASVRPEWRFRFGDATDLGIDSGFDQFGAMYSVNNGENRNLQARRSWPNHAARTMESAFVGDSPALAIDRSGRVSMIKNDSGQWNLYRSDDAMWSWEKTESELLQGSVEMARLVALRGGGFVQVVKSGSEFRYLAVGADGSRSIGRVPLLKSAQELSIAQDESGHIWAINEKGETVALSRDNGAVWREV